MIHFFNSNNIMDNPFIISLIIEALEETNKPQYKELSQFLIDKFNEKGNKISGLEDLQQMSTSTDLMKVYIKLLQINDKNIK